MKVTKDHEIALHIALLVERILNEICRHQKTPNIEPSFDLSKLPNSAGYASGYLYLLKEVVYQARRAETSIGEWRPLLEGQRANVEYVSDPDLLSLADQFSVRALFRIYNGSLEIKFSAVFGEGTTIIETFTLPSPRMSLCQALAYLENPLGAVKLISEDESFYLTYVGATLCTYFQHAPNGFSTPSPYKPQLRDLSKETRFTIVPSNEIPKDLVQ